MSYEKSRNCGNCKHTLNWTSSEPCDECDDCSNWEDCDEKEIKTKICLAVQQRNQRRIAEQEDVVNILEYQLSVERKKLEDMEGNSYDNESR